MEVNQNKHVEELWTVANDYCLFLEGCKEYPLQEVTEYFRKILPLLYLKGALLPKVDFVDDVIPERFVSEEHYENIYMAALTKFKEYPADSWEIGKGNPEYVSEALADIYQDLKDFTVLLQKPLSAEKQNAIAECHSLFLDHWGLRLAELMPVLHGLSLSTNEGNEEYDYSDLE